MTLITLFFMSLLVPKILMLLVIPWLAVTMGFGVALSFLGLPPMFAFPLAAIVSAVLELYIVTLLYPASPALGFVPVENKTASDSAPEASILAVDFDAG